MAVSQRLAFGLLLFISMILLILVYLLPAVTYPIKLLLIVLCLFMDLLAFSTKYYMDFFIPFLKIKGRDVTISGSEAFTMAPSNNAIVSRKGEYMYASAFVRIPTYTSATEMNQEDKVEFAKLFSRALTITKKPVKFASQLYVINKDEYITHIRDKLNESEEKYQNAIVNRSISKTESERIKGEVTMWHNLFDNVNKVKSQALEAYAMVTAAGGNEDEAISLALQEADEVAAGISAIFGVTATIVEGEELLRCVEPDYMIPLVTISEQIREKSMVGES